MKIREMARSATAAGVVSVATFGASAAHIVKVVDETNPLATSVLYPVGVDVLGYVGLRAMQQGRKFAGFIALLIGAAYSFLFNADAENALKMDPMLIAASMPVCFLVSILIRTTGQKVVIEDVTEDVPSVQPSRTWTDAGRRTELPIVPLRPSILRVPSVLVDETVHETVLAIPSTRPTVQDVIPSTVQPSTVQPSSDGRGRRTEWDVEKTVRMVLDGSDNEVIASATGVSPKNLSRVRTVIRKVQAGEQLAGPVAGLSYQVTARIVEAMA